MRPVGFVHLWRVSGRTVLPVRDLSEHRPLPKYSSHFASLTVLRPALSKGEHVLCPGLSVRTWKNKEFSLNGCQLGWWGGVGSCREHEQVTSIIVDNHQDHM